jgi:hypothetical protein
MKKLSLSDIGNLAEAIAAVAVVVSIVYLALQIRQNTNAVRAASYQEVARGVADFQTMLAQNEGLADVYIRGINDPAQLSANEELRFEMVLGQLFSRYDVAYYLYDQDLIDDRAMQPFTRFILALLESPGITEYWKEAQHFFSNPMRDYLNQQKDS